MDAVQLETFNRGVGNFLTRLSSVIKKGLVQSFTKTGLLQGPLKEWYGTTTSVNGVFSFDITSARFKQILHVDPVVVHNSTSFNAQVTPSINTCTTTLITGRVFTGSSALIKIDPLVSGGNVTVMIKVTGL